MEEGGGGGGDHAAGLTSDSPPHIMQWLYSKLSTAIHCSHFIPHIPPFTVVTLFHIYRHSL